MRPIIFHITPEGPNPWKVILIAEELGLPYEINSFSTKNVKDEPFISINPNGRVPAIEDPNTGLVLWESGAIILYLIEQYDDKKKLTYESLIEKNHLIQWLMFQLSGQGPYFGQAGWFRIYHPEKLPSAMERYDNELKRILSVLDHWLNGKQWLVGSKMTYADLSFVPWNIRVGPILGRSEETMFDEFPNVKAWHARMVSRDSWKKLMEMRAKLMREQGLI